MRYRSSHKRPGYIFLITVLVVGAIASAAGMSMLLLGWAAEQNGLLLVQSAQAYENAQTCVERTLQQLRTDPTYDGNVTITLTRGSCSVLAIGGSGNESRTICAEGVNGNNTRRVEVAVSKLFPSVKIRLWQEVSEFTLCE